ncbi:MAG: alkaline phosphatase family protein [Planctomycetota bacterium]|jgi:predicted AlkP superfamily phosphohydrolase/phosphomutase/4-hydroxybenzoate polyprenyltransferase
MSGSLRANVRPVTLWPPATGVVAGAAAATAVAPAPLSAAAWWPVAAGALSAALLNAASNAANNLADRDADRINKPERAAARGSLLALTAVTAIAGLALALAAGWQFLLCALAAGIASAAYSAPPLRLKRWGWSAGLSIACARGWLLIVAGWATVGDVFATAGPWWLGLPFFVFITGAAATKDFADVAGDRAEGIRSWPVELGPERAANRVGWFLILPWLGLPLLACAGHHGHALGLRLVPGPLVIGALLLAGMGLAGWGELRRRPAARSSAGENHPAWLLMYAQMVVAQLVVCWAAWQPAPPRTVDPGRRLLIVGLDGLDPVLLERFIAAGDCPTFAALRDGGGGNGSSPRVRRLATTAPPVSPVAWATFATGLPPSEHRVMGFIRREAAQYALRNGLVTGDPPHIANARRGVSFWHRLRAAGIPAAAYWVPVSFPPEQAPPGEEVAGLGVPDGRLGLPSYTRWDTAEPFAPGETVRDTEFGGKVVRFAAGPQGGPGLLPGPLGSRLTVRFDRATAPDGGRALRIALPNGSAVVAEGAWSPWLPAPFAIPPGALIHTRFQCYVREAGERIHVYARALQLAPGAVPIPLSRPRGLMQHLHTVHGPQKTAGWTEETFGCQEAALPPGVVLADALADLDRRSRIVSDRLAAGDWACTVAVFTEVDRVSHCFWRDPAGLRAVYRAADAAVARIRAAAPPDTDLLVVSDHGFRAFDRAVSLNAWLRREGYLRLRDDAALRAPARAMGRLGPAPITLDDVDWSRTHAYAVGLGGVFLNRVGREGRGIVTAAQAPALLAEIRAGLLALRDRERPGTPVVDTVRTGPESGYAADDPHAADLLVGFASGYRVSWQTALGGSHEPVIAPNDRPWSGDHCSAPPEAVPGVCLASFPLPDRPLHLRDVAPSDSSLRGGAWLLSAARR